MPSKAVITYEGREYEPTQTRMVSPGDYFVDQLGRVVQSHYQGEIWLVVKLLPIVHIFGGIAFEETDVCRQVVAGEWYLYPATNKQDAHPVNKPAGTPPTVQRYKILRHRCE